MLLWTPFNPFIIIIIIIIILGVEILQDRYAWLQAMAEEKFKLCSNAYRSLCSALSPA